MSKNLIFFLFSCLFCEFAVRADVEITTEIIDTNELSEYGQQLIKGIKEKNLRYSIKKTLILEKEKDEEIKKLKGEIEKKDKVIAKKDEVIAEKDVVIAGKDVVIAKKDEVIAEKDEVVKNSYHNYMSCAINLIKTALEIGFPPNLHKKFTPTKNIFPKEYIDGPAPDDIYLLIKRDHKWLPKYNKHNPNISFEAYNRKIEHNKGEWLNYFCTVEGLELAYFIAPPHLEESRRKLELMRFAYHMSRLFIISCACHHKLLSALEDQISKNDTLSLVTHLRKLVPEWSCTLEQIKFFNKLATYMYSKSERLSVAKFAKFTITTDYNTTYEMIFVVPYKKKNCGLLNDDELYSDADTKERKK